MKTSLQKNASTRQKGERNGLFIVFEGIDGSGKSTQACLLAEKLHRRGLEVVRLSEPTRGKWGEKIRELSKNSDSLSPREELALFIKDRREDVRKNIRPALEAGKVVILDRYFYSTLAYQGARGISLEEIRQKHRSFVILPDLVFILDVPVSTGLRRIKDRPVIYRLFEEKEYLKKVREIFLSLPDPECLIIDGRLPAEVIHRKIWSILCRKFPELK